MCVFHSEQRGSGPDLVMLHGWGMDSDSWGSLLPELSRQFRLTLIELPGHGRDRQGRFPESLPDMIAALSEVVPERATWLGWSLGGMLAIAFAEKFSSRVDALILVAASPRFVVGPKWTAAMPKTVFTQFVDGFEQDPVVALKRFIALQFVGVEGVKTLVRQLQSRIVARNASKFALLQGLALLGSLDLSVEYMRLECPILSVLGGCDQLVPSQVGVDMQAMNSRTQLHILPQAGHLPFITHTQQFRACLELFLND